MNNAVATAHTILVTDPDPLALATTIEILENAGYAALHAVDGAGTLSQVRAHRPSLVLLEIDLPDINGLEVLRQIRAETTLNAVSVVLLSAPATSADQQAFGLDCGADGYIIRPVAKVELLARIRAQLRQHHRIEGCLASEARIRMLIEQQVDAVLVVDRLGMIQYANLAAGALFGRRPVNLEGTPFGFPIVTADGATAQELDIPRGDRQSVVTEMRVTPVEWEGRQAWIATLRDITARQMAEQAGRESQALLDMATKVAHLGAWSIDLVTGTRIWSDKTREIFDVAPGATLPLSDIVALIAPEQRAVVLQSFDACVRNGTPFEFETELTTITGRHMYLRGLGEAVRNEAKRIVRVQGAFQDITHQKQVEQQIARSERRFRELTEAMPMIVWTATPDGAVDYFNQRFFEYTGVSPDQPVDRCWQQTLPHADLERCGPAWAQALQTGDTFETEFRIRRDSDQSFRWHFVRAVAIREHTGAIVRWYGTAMDVHALRMLQEKAEQLAERLTQARDQAEQASLAKSRFLAGMSHELRTPLNGVLGYAQLLHLEGGLTASQSARVRGMLDAGTHLLGMINSVLDFSQIEAGRLELRPCAVDPRTTARACLDVVRPAAEAKGLTLHLVEMPDVPRVVTADPTRLREVLLNLLGNAVKFTARGSVEFRLQVATDAAALRVEIVDTGPGIPADVRQRLFQDFERLGADSNGAVEGAGLGLAISARLMSLMGGKLGHQENPAGGSVFWLELPLTPMAAASVVAAVPDRRPRLERQLHLLVVDDVAMNREIASALLQAAGHEVVCAESGQEAVEAAAAGGFDAVLMDLRMPGMDGFEAARRIRALTGVHGQVPIIALTAQVFAEHVEACRRAGMDGHLAKPFTQDALLEAIAHVVTVAQARRRTIPASSDVTMATLAAPDTDPAVAAVPIAAVSSSSTKGSDLSVCDQASFEYITAFLSSESVTTYMQSLAARAAALLHALREPVSPAAGSDGLAAAAHSLVGIAGMFGFRRLALAARSYQRAVETASLETPSLIDNLVGAIEASLLEIERRVLAGKRREENASARQAKRSVRRSPLPQSGDRSHGQPNLTKPQSRRAKQRPDVVGEPGA